jgi:antitoxin (DNA-binding transcriptional repressor) of toxin-antitoxin stability system
LGYGMNPYLVEGEEGEITTLCHRDKADARLIAAAPDLLEALSKLTALFEKHPASKQPLTASAIEAARAAIAKAEGKP